MNENQLVLYVPGSHYLCAFYPPEGPGRETLMKEYPEARVMLLSDAIDQIMEAEDKAYLNNPWKEITEEEWSEALNVLPPEKWVFEPGCEIFRMSEYLTSNITSHYVRTKKAYYTNLRRTSTRYADIVKEIAEIEGRVDT